MVKRVNLLFTRFILLCFSATLTATICTSLVYMQDFVAVKNSVIKIDKNYVNVTNRFGEFELKSSEKFKYVGQEICDTVSYGFMLRTAKDKVTRQNVMNEKPANLVQEFMLSSDTFIIFLFIEVIIIVLCGVYAFDNII